MVDEKPTPSSQPATEEKPAKAEEITFEEDDLFEEFGSVPDADAAAADQPAPLWVEEWDDEEQDKEDFSMHLARELEQNSHAMQ